MTTEPIPATASDQAQPADGEGQPEREAAPRGATAAQLRRFIKSRPYVPLHELRRRFELNGELDDVCRVEGVGGALIYVGLPERESELLGELVRSGDVGVELSRDPRVPIVIGVYAMKPAARTS